MYLASYQSWKPELFVSSPSVGFFFKKNCRLITNKNVLSVVVGFSVTQKSTTDL